MTDDLKKLVNNSGYLLQLRIEHEVRSTETQHRWKVLVREHPWLDGSGRGSYVDLILHKHHDFTYLVIECKRRQTAKWVFLVPSAEPDAFRLRCCWAAVGKDGSHLKDYDEFRASPASSESEFCIVRGSGEDEPSFLERISGKLLDATARVALEQLPLSGQDPETDRWIFVPLIITTAELWICRFDPTQVTLNDGKLSEATFERVPFVRFRKSLTTRLTNKARPTDLAQVNQDKQRTVVVINSTELVGFLSNWKLERENCEQSWPWRIPG